MFIKSAISLSPKFLLFDPVAQHGCKLPTCVRCLNLMKVSKRWRFDRFCHVIDFFYPKLFLSKGFECSSSECSCEFLASNPIYTSTIPNNIKELIPFKTKTTMDSRKLLDELTQDIYRFNNAAE